MLVPFSALGIAVLRSESTILVVLFDAGLYFEIALKYAVVPALSIWIGEIPATPLVCETFFSNVVKPRIGSARITTGRTAGELLEPDEPDEPELDEDEDFELDELEELEELELAGLAGEPSLTAIRSGPLVPGPKLLAVRSYARRTVVDVEYAAMSCWPSVSESSGIASGIRIASATAPHTTGRLEMSLAHFAHSPFFASSVVGG